MKKIAIFLEGHGELIFMRNILPHLITPDKLYFQCLELHKNRLEDVPYECGHREAELQFLLINVGNDEKVMSAIKEREVKLFRKGYSKIIGLRDMYSRAYRERSKNEIDDEVSVEFIEAAKKIIETLSYPEQIYLHFSIMELETWWLAMYNLFLKLNGELTCEYIENELGYDLSIIDPQKCFFHPAKTLGEILGLVGITYDKKRKEVEKITSCIECDDIFDATENNRCSSFKDFYEDVIT